MKITLITPSFPHPRRSLLKGAERYVENLALSLKETGNEIKVITTFWNGGERQDIYNGIPILRILDSKALIGKLGSIFFINHVTFGLNLFRKKNFKWYCDSDIIFLLISFPFTRFFKIKGIPVISIYFHHDPIRRLVDYLTYPALHYMEKRQYLMHENIIAISNFTKIELIKHYNIDDGNIEVIPVGINSNKFNPSNHSIDIRNKYGNNILLYSGLMTPRKRISVLLKAIPHVIKEIPEAHLILMGQGPSFKRYLKFSKALGIQDHVSFLGFVNDKELVKFYASSDIFVFPSELEGFGQVLLEAMASNTPVLCANKPPMSKIIGNGGLTFELNDHKDLAKKIINLLKNREILNELKNNTLNVIKNYEWMHVAQNFIDYIQKKQLNIMKARNYNAKYFNND